MNVLVVVEDTSLRTGAPLPVAGKVARTVRSNACRNTWPVFQFTPIEGSPARLPASPVV